MVTSNAMQYIPIPKNYERAAGCITQTKRRQFSKTKAIRLVARTREMFSLAKMIFPKLPGKDCILTIAIHFAMVRAFGLTILALLIPALAAPVLKSLEARQSGCADVMVVYARGTNEQSPIGDPASVGVVFRDNIKSLLGSRTFSFQGVNYAANVFGFLEGGDPAGSRQMAADLTSVANSCPNAKIVSAGYSQGGQLVHNSADQLTTAAIRNRINAVVIFCDPKRDQAVAGIPSSKVKIICHDGDHICDGGFIVTSQHTNYQQDAPAAAQFVISQV
ncbi:hypothetical protein MPER_12611 [Moniliophthora perniciosa FA553]|nr:hypothetical protein MPER_12611 [Moniliophthora perniciosa FA553]